MLDKEFVSINTTLFHCEFHFENISSRDRLFHKTDAKGEKQLGSHWINFRENICWAFLLKICLQSSSVVKIRQN